MTRAEHAQETGFGSVRALLPASAWIATGVFAAISLYLVVPLTPLARRVVGATLLTLLPLASAVACSVAARRAAADARAAWLLFAGAALLVFAGQVAWVAEMDAGLSGDAFPRSALVLLPLFHPVFVAGAIYALRWDRMRRFAPEIALDSVLILLAGLIVVMRLVVEPSRGLSGGRLTLVLIIELLSIASVLAAALMVVWRTPSISSQAAAGLFLATAFFAVGNVLSAAGFDPEPVWPGDAFDLLWLAGWAAFAWAGLAGSTLASPRVVGGGEGWGVARFRRSIVPGAALFLALIVIDGSLGRPMRPLTGLLAGLLCAALGLRIAFALSAADRHAQDERRYQHAQVLIDVSHLLAGAMDVSRVLSLISDAARRVLTAKAAGIELLSDDGSTLVTRTALGLPDDILGLQFPVEGSFTGWVVQHAAPRATVDPQTDPYIQPQSRPYLGRSPVAAAPLRFGARTFGVLYGIRDRPFTPEELELLGALGEQAAVAMENARLFEQVTTMSLTDPLTGLANRRQLERDLAREFAAARRGRPLTAVMFDIDDFKEYNDRYGHLAGDDALKALATALKVETRAMNLAGRYGGDEFVVLLSDADEAGARLFVERVARRFSKEVRELGHGALTVSAGHAYYDGQMADWLQLLEAADRELYRAKPPRART
ncbi:MAG: sensor domain-containing diguanylate cyclase [Gemmatimonadota bacterium]